MPDTARPHMKAGSSICDSTMSTFSAADSVPNCVGITTRPMRPMEMALNSEMTTHTTAMMREARISLCERMERKRVSTCGMPK